MIGKQFRRGILSTASARNMAVSVDLSRQIRETKTAFERPNLVSFDLFGTLYTPRTPVYLQYSDIACKEFGIQVSSETVKQRFPVVHEDLLARYPNYGRDSGEIADPDHWWSELIVRLFEIPHFSSDTESKRLCSRLLDHFKGPGAYQLYDDVIPTLHELKRMGIRLAFLSNSDPRVFQIVHNLGLGEYANEDNIFISYMSGYSKPDKRIFDKVISSHFRPSAGVDAQSKSDFLERCWHVGDSYEQDFLGAVKSGWNGVLLDRNENSHFYQNVREAEKRDQSTGCELSGGAQQPKSDHVIHLANNRVVLNDLSRMLELFK